MNEIEYKYPPQEKELEKAILGALILESNAYDRISDILKPEHFYDKAHQKIFRAIQTLSLHQRPVDIFTVQDQLQKEQILDEIGGISYLIELSNKVVSSAHLEYHSQIVVQKYFARQLIIIGTNIQKKAYVENADVKDLMEEAQSDLFDLTRQSMKNDMIQINPVIDEAIKQHNRVSQQNDGISGLKTGFIELDKITSGWQSSDLIILAARPAMGKTALALSMAKIIAVDNGIGVGLFSLEMSNLQLVNRLIINICEIPGNKFKSGQLSQNEKQALNLKHKELYNAPLYIDDTPNLSIYELSAKAKRIVKEHGVRILIIDYLQLINANGSKFGNREQEVSTVSRALKALAKELNIPIIALSQVNRAPVNRGQSTSNRSVYEANRPQLSDLRESGAIEQDADIVCFIHRPEYYNIDVDPNGFSTAGRAELIVAKHRNGSTGEIRLKFHKEYAKFTDDMDNEGTFYPDYIGMDRSRL